MVGDSQGTRVSDAVSRIVVSRQNRVGNLDFGESHPTPDRLFPCFSAASERRIVRTFLVTGGAGFIGSHLTEALVKRHDKVRVLDNLSTGHLSNLDAVRDKIEFIEADLLDPQAVAAAVDGVDCVFHQAALASVPRSVAKPLDTHAACVTGTVILLDAARRAGVRRLVYAASSSAYGDRSFSSKRERLPLPISPMPAKLAAEFTAEAFTRPTSSRRSRSAISISARGKTPTAPIRP